MSAHRRRWLVLAAALTAVLVTVGCGSGAGEDSSSAATGLDDRTGSSTTTATADSGSEVASADGCDIVSDQVAADVLGVEIVRREAHGEPGSGSVSCIKGTARATGPVSDQSGTSFVSVAQVAGAASLVDEASAEAGSLSVAGVGDRAVFLPSAGVLFIADGADEMQVQVVKAGVPGSQQDCVTVANDMLERRN